MHYSMSNEEKALNDKIEKLEEKLKQKGVKPVRKKATKADKAAKKAESQQRRLENKLMRVVTKAGVSWASWSALLEVSDTIEGCPLPLDTACWVYNEHTKQERIIFSTRIMKELPVNLLLLVLKHEMLHKSMYRGTKEVGNQELMNFALDAAINKILWLSNPKQAKKLGDWLVPKESDGRSGIHAILNPGVETADFENMDPRIKMIVEDIWWVTHEKRDPISGLTVDAGSSCCDYYEKTTKFGNAVVPDPMTLYNKMSALLSKADKKKIKKLYAFMGAGQQQKDGKPNPDHIRGGDKNLRAVDKKTRQAEKDFARKVLEAIEKEGHKQDGGRWRGGDGHSAYTDMNAFFQEYVYTTKDSETEGLNDFIHRWETLKQIETVCHTIHATFKRVSTIEPFPNELTRTGLELVTLGVSGPELPYFFNLSSAGDGGAKKKICCYFDCSPSMDDFIPYMLYVADFVDGCEEAEIAGGKFKGKYVFSEKVKGIPEHAWEDFKNGKIRGGCGTSFESVAKHALDRIEQDQVDIILVFTDGFSSIGEKTIQRFRESGRKCYTIYFSHGNFDYGHDRYSGYGRNAKIQGIDDEHKMYSDLDKLPGESFTIWCKQGK